MDSQNLKKPLLAWFALLPLLILVFGPSFSGGFLFDDYSGIQNNGEIREVSIANLIRLVRSHHDVRAVDHHPVPAVTFMADYQWTALDPFGYRITNLISHWLTCGIILLWLLEIWRIRSRQAKQDPDHPEGFWFAASLTLLWAVHPLSSMTVSYITGRQENLLIGFSALSMYALLRGWPIVSYGAAVAAFLCKEVAVALPGSLFLLDWCQGGEGVLRTFRNRIRYYCILTASWLLLCVYHLRGSRTHELGVNGPPLSTPIAYFKAQCGVIASYFSKQFCPAPLEFYPYIHPVESAAEWVPFLIAILVYIAIAVYSLRWSRWLAVALIFPLLVLSPTSSVIPISFEPAMEYRMYFPSIAIWALLLTAAWHWLKPMPARLALSACLILFYGTLTHLRSYDYQSAQTLTEKDLAANPKNLHAFEGLANIYTVGKRFELGQQMGWKLVDWALSQNNKNYASRGYNVLGENQMAQGHKAEAKEHFLRAAALSNYWPAVLNQARLHVDLYELKEAEPLLRNYLAIFPHNQDAILLLYERKMSGNQVDEAEKIFEDFMKLYPERDDLDVQRTRILRLRKKLANP
ncbi:MAG: hypothetical protein FJW36_14175 [Acidobacteria bacterium]|nr:hypothetical protein [Acidobacteriota bacterium]